MPALRSLALALAILSACSAPARDADASGPAAPEARRQAAGEADAEPFVLQPVVRGLKQPVGLVFAPDDPERRLFVVEKGGTVRVIRDGRVEAEPFLDLSRQVSRGAEQGLLGLAFHPDFARNGRLFVNYTDRRGDTRVVEFNAGPGGRAGKADPATAREWLHLPQPYANHNGGNLIFGPDGRLWIGTGDGGAANDPLENAQNPASLLGKMLRLDVDRPGAEPEIVLLGLRNPWRYAFDRATGDLYIADVGQNRWEEVNVLPAGTIGGQNLGWDIVEGMGHCVERPDCRKEGLTPPVAEYSHAQGCSITGGTVYRGRAIPEIQGLYFYTDFCSARLWSFRYRDGRAEELREWAAPRNARPPLRSPTAFGEGPDGELYVLSIEGTIYRFAPRPTGP